MTNPTPQPLTEKELQALRAKVDSSSSIRLQHSYKTAIERLLNHIDILKSQLQAEKTARMELQNKVDNFDVNWEQQQLINKHNLLILGEVSIERDALKRQVEVLKTALHGPNLTGPNDP